MKFIDLLVQELPNLGGWPEGVYDIGQDWEGHLFEMESDYKSYSRFQLADDWLSACVTREQYEAALAASKRCIHEWIPSEGRTSSGVLCRKCGDYNGPGEAEKSDTDGWIAWGGGVCPVEHGKLVDVRYRNGSESFGLPARESIRGNPNAHQAYWDNDNNPHDIIAYRLHQPQDANTRANDDRLTQNSVFEGISLRHRRDGFETPEAKFSRDGALPPIGCYCEVVDPDGILMYGEDESGEVVAHVENTAVIRMSYGLGCFEARFLRPVLSDREKALADMRAVVTNYNKTEVLHAIEQLYDAGYRKIAD